ncbi:MULTISPECIES: hypothetical protein [unclassified Providencia]|uniref:hypothetical protein n=1 Tax=unclassified Providencia TaxID=2633465 RepID=UPI001B7C8190|nr:hypothetical protein [Providencia sp.]MBP6080995.1 hypothetical protein [Providencia sp.]
MKLLTFTFQCMGGLVFMFTINSMVLAADLSMMASIAKKGVGCEITLPQNVLTFAPLSMRQLKGPIQAHQIKSLIVRLSCVNETELIKPMLTLRGITPYAEDLHQTVFLDDTPNGVGFMVRQSPDDKPIGLLDFYQPDAAIGNDNTVQPLNVLNNDNQYKSDNVLWVGIVGPLQSNIIAGRFHASLTINVAFQ